MDHIENEILNHNPEQDIRYILFRTLVLLGTAFSSIVLLSYLFTRRPLINGLTMGGVILFGLLMYRLSRNPRQYTLARVCVYAVLGVPFLPFAYFTTPGSAGSIPYYSLLLIFIFTVMAVHPWEYLFPAAVIVIMNGLFRLELEYPEALESFASQGQKIFDLNVNYSLVALFVVGVLIYIMRRYHSYSLMLMNRSVTDMLTGLYNKRYLDENAEYELNRCERKGDNLSLMFIDLNNFKKINDTLGHKEGDKVLQEIAGIIRKNTRNYDICARYGGDEFLILLPSTSRDQARQQIRRLDEAFSSYAKKYSNQGFSVSFGVADSGDGDFAALMELADRRLYADKTERKRS